MISRIKGTLDLLDRGLYNWIEKKIKKHLTDYHFKEIATPIIEPIELFKRSLGLETDVVSKEMYYVSGSTSSDTESEKICLRPEMTASIMRAFLNAGIQETPWKVFSIGPAFRHERPQKGRYRQFNQISMEIIGSESIMQDALFLAMLDHFFSHVLKLQGYGLLINYLGTRQDRAAYQKILHRFLVQESARLCNLCKHRMNTNIMRVFDCKEHQCQEIYSQAPTLIDALAQESVHEWKLLKHTLEELSVSYSIKPTLVRGLDYYNKTVFEFVATDGLGAQNTFCGGGRYDTLACALGAKDDYPSLGAAIGLERLALFIEAQRPLTDHAQEPILSVVIPLTAEQQPLGLQIVQLLHAQGKCADIVLDKASIKGMFKAANKMHAQWAILIGPDEQRDGMITLKNMTTGHEEKIRQGDLLEHIK